jgi:hypothetical protein
MNKKTELHQAIPQVITMKLDQDKINNPNKREIHPAKVVATLGAIKTHAKQPRTLVEWIDAAQHSITLRWAPHGKASK